MRQYFAKNILFLILVNLLIKPVWILGIDAKVQVLLGNEIYGSYMALLNIGLIFNILLDLGLQNYNNRVVAQAHNTFTRLFPNIMATKAVFSVVYFGVLMLVGLLLDYSITALQLLAWIALIQVFNSFYLFIRSNIAARQLYKTDSLLSVLDRTLLIVVCGGLLYFPLTRTAFDIFLYAKVQALTLGVTGLIGYIVLLQHFQVSWGHIRYSKIAGIIRQSIPYSILVFTMAVFMRADMVLLELMAGSTAAGEFAEAFRLLDVANNMSGVLIGGMLLSFFSRYLRDSTTIRNISSLCNRTLLPFAVIATVVCVIYSRDILALIYTGKEIPSGLHLSLLILAYPFYCLMYIYSTYLTALNRIRTLTGIAMAAIVISIAGNAIGIPLYGVTATAVVHPLTIAVFSITCLLYCNKFSGLQLLDGGTLARLLLLGTASGIIFYALSATSLHFLVQIPAGLLLAACCYAVLNLSAIRKLLSKLSEKYRAG